MLPEGWKKKSFGDVVNIANGLIDPREISFKDIKHIGPENVISNTGRIVNEKTCGDLKLISGKYEFDANSIVYSKIRPNLNKVCTPSYSGVCSADMYVLHPRKGIDKNFLFFSILGNSFKNRAISMSMRTGMPKINREDLSSIPILLPPLPEQKKIAAILSTWDRAIEGTEKLLANSQQQKKALMQQLLTGKKRLPGFTGEWEKHRLCDCCHVVMGSSPKSEFYNETGEGLPLLQGNADIKNRLSCPRIFTSEITKECQLGDILLSVRAPVGTVSIALHHACIGRGISSIRVKKGNSQEFAYQYFLSIEDRWERLAQGSTFEAVNGDDIKKLTILLPSFPEQKAIAAVLTTADEEITALESDLSRLRQEKKALMQQLLTGKIRVAV